MSRDRNSTADFERQAHDLLEESVQRVGGRARSRLNQARHAALAEAARAPRWHLPARLSRRPLMWLPAAGAVVAAVLVAFMLSPRAPQGYPAAAEANRTSAADLELLADRDGMDLMEDGDGQFYEWAMVQAGKAGQPADPRAASQDKSHGVQSSGGDTDRNSG